MPHIRRGIEVGTVVSAAGGRSSERQGVAAVEINRASFDAVIFSGTATGHNGTPRYTENLIGSYSLKRGYSISGVVSKWS